MALFSNLKIIKNYRRILLLMLFKVLMAGLCPVKLVLSQSTAPKASKKTKDLSANSANYFNPSLCLNLSFFQNTLVKFLI